MANENQVAFFPNVFILKSACCLSSKVEERKGYFSHLSCKVGTGQHPSEEFACASVQSAVTTFPLLDNSDLCKPH